MEQDRVRPPEAAYAGGVQGLDAPAALGATKGEFVTIFYADHVPQKEFLKDAGTPPPIERVGWSK